MKTDQRQKKPVAAKSATSLVWRPNDPQGSISGLPLFLQPKLAIGQPGDPSEIEADQIADQVMRMPVSTVQRQCVACEEEEAVTVSRKAEGTVAGEAPRSVHSTLRSPGQPLAASTRTFFEPRFGQDLSQVRVHADPEAQQSAREVNALAYTVGSHVVFDAGRYAPGTPDGQRLLAHELTHVVQQTGTGVSVPVVSRKQTDWPAWHQDILRDVINVVSATADLGEAVQWRWLLRYLCGLSPERAQSLYARWNRSALAVPGNKDDFPLFILANFGAHYDEVLALLEEIGAGPKPRLCALPQEESHPAASKTETAPPASVPAAPSDGKAASDLPPEPIAEVATGKEMRVHAPADPGWVPVRPIYVWFKAGEPFFVPHFLRVFVWGVMVYDKNQIVVEIQEGKYEGKDAIIDRAYLQDVSGLKGFAGMSYHSSVNELYYGGQGPVEAVSHRDKIPDPGTYDLSVPDFPHDKAKNYGPYATTWFLIGDGGDKYFHPGMTSLGCITVRDLPYWPKIWEYLIDARKDDGYVGTIRIDP